MSVRSWINGLVGGLLVSSCCLVQLLLNLFGIGCAGLNTLLLPYRSVFVSLTVVSLTYSFFRYRPSKRHMASIVVFTLLLSFSPELLRTYNDQLTDSSSSSNQSDKGIHVTHWKIQGMHCEACRSAVIQALRKVNGIDSVDVQLETGHATLAGPGALDRHSITQAVNLAGFQAEEIR